MNAGTKINWSLGISDRTNLNNIPQRINSQPCDRGYREIKYGILKLTIRRGQSLVFIFVSSEENGYYRVVSVGQLSFDCRSYCGLICRMQGYSYRNWEHWRRYLFTFLLKINLVIFLLCSKSIIIISIIIIIITIIINLLFLLFYN